MMLGKAFYDYCSVAKYKGKLWFVTRDFGTGLIELTRVLEEVRDPDMPFPLYREEVVKIDRSELELRR